MAAICGPDPAPEPLRVGGIIFQTALTPFSSLTWQYLSPHTSPRKARFSGLRLQAALDLPTQTQVRTAPGSDATRNTKHRGSINMRRSLRKGPPAAPPRPSRRASSREEAASASVLASLCRPDYSESQEN